MKDENIVQILKDEFNHRKSKNHLYSVRSFARDINMSKTTLSALMTGSRKPSLKTVYKIVEALPYLFPKKDVFQNLEGTRRISDELFSPISNWYYLAIFHLAEFPDNEASGEWISKKISIPKELADEALETLVSLNYLRVEDHKMIRTSRPIVVNSETRDGSRSIRNHHKQKLKLAIDAIDTLPPEQREFNSITFPFSRKDLHALKEIINSFAHKVRIDYASPEPDDLMSLSIQLMPLKGSYE